VLVKEGCLYDPAGLTSGKEHEYSLSKSLGGTRAGLALLANQNDTDRFCGKINTSQYEGITTNIHEDGTGGMTPMGIRSREEKAVRLPLVRHKSHVVGYGIEPGPLR